MPMIEIQSPTRAMFVAAVKAFKLKHLDVSGKPGKLKHLFDSEQTPEAEKNITALLSDPVIHAYLSRTMSEVVFQDLHPKLSDSATKNKTEHSETDHYELKIYKHLPYRIIFRDENINQSAFYFRGTLGTRLLKELFNLLFKNITKNISDIQANGPLDIYEIRTDIITKNLQSPQPAILPRFTLYANWKDDHATTIINIMDPTTQRTLVTLLLNNLQDKNYFDYISARILDYVSMNINGKFSGQIIQTPFIDVSHNLQLGNDDMNCALYSLNFIKGLTEMLKNREIADKAYALASNIKTSLSAEEELRIIFQETLKEYIPEYYDPHGTKKSPKALQEFHLQQRWDLGTLSLETFFPILAIPVDDRPIQNTSTIAQPTHYFSPLSPPTPIDSTTLSDSIKKSSPSK